MKTLRFVLDKHEALKAGLHYDLRIQKSINTKTLYSFAIRNGIPKDSKKYLAIRTKDHDWKALFFHGKIAQGEYGAGTITKVDYGTCELIKDTSKVKVYNFQGKKSKLIGPYALIHLSKNRYLFLKTHK